LNPRIVFHSRKKKSWEILPDLVQKTKDVYVLPELSQCVSTTTSFDLWMSKNAYNIFALVINFLDENWQPKKVIIGLFEVIETTCQTLVINLSELLDSYGLKKIIAYVKDEGANLNFKATTFKFIVNCEILGLEESSNDIYFGHAFLKTYQYVIIEEEVCKNLKIVSIKFAQFEI
jgi:hypothetical protein